MTDAKKNSSQNKNLGQFKVVGGAVVIAAPDEEATNTVSSAATVVDSTQGTVTIKVEGDSDTSQVINAESELLSNATAAQVRAENLKAHQEAQTTVQARKAGSSVVTSGTFNDINLPEYDTAIQSSTSPAVEEQTPVQQDKLAEKKKLASEEAFHAALQDALNEQSEDFVEAYEED